MEQAELQELIEAWREEARGAWCQKYNKGMAAGLERAANDLETVLQARKQSVRPDTLRLLRAECKRLTAAGPVRWTLDRLLRALLLHWQARPPSALPVENDLYSVFESNCHPRHCHLTNCKDCDAMSL